MMTLSTIEPQESIDRRIQINEDFSRKREIFLHGFPVAGNGWKQRFPHGSRDRFREKIGLRTGSVIVKKRHGMRDDHRTRAVHHASASKPGQFSRIQERRTIP